MTEYTKGLCDFITNLKFEHLAPELTDKAKKLTLHVVGAALSGRTLPTAVSARTAARAVVGTQADLMSTMWGGIRKSPYARSSHGQCYCRRYTGLGRL